MKSPRFAVLVPALAVCALLLSFPRTVVASPPSQAEADVLRQEARWLTAIVNGDRKTVAAILTTDYKHITDEAKRFDRAGELASTVKLALRMNATEETVDFAGETAVVHGLNTITQSGKVLARELFTDVFVEKEGVWMALSAQETAVHS